MGNKKLYKITGKNKQTYHGYYSSIRQAVSSFQAKYKQSIKDMEIKSPEGFSRADLRGCRDILWT